MTRALCDMPASQERIASRKVPDTCRLTTDMTAIISQVVILGISPTANATASRSTDSRTGLSSIRALNAARSAIRLAANNASRYEEENRGRINTLQAQE